MKLNKIAIVKDFVETSLVDIYRATGDLSLYAQGCKSAFERTLQSITGETYIDIRARLA